MGPNHDLPPPSETDSAIDLQTNESVRKEAEEPWQDSETSGLHPDIYEAKYKSPYTAVGHEFRRLTPSPAPSGRLSPVPPGPYNPLQAPQSPDPVVSPFKTFWINNRPSMLVALSQFFGALMNLSARFLELEGEGMHPFQVLLLRQGLTVLACCLYMWYIKQPEFPFGKKEIRWLLAIRGFAGFFGIYGMWYSMMYLPLADATVITFLAPGVAGAICYFALREPFTRSELMATGVALMGVVLIARPVALFSASRTNPAAEDSEDPHGTGLPGLGHEATAQERLVAVGVALLGVLGASIAFTTLRAIGKRAHPVISVNVFGMACTLICLCALVFAPMFDIAQPQLRWVMPGSLRAWGLLLSLGVLGFIMQYLLTSGLSMDKSNKANAMIYTHMLFAVTFDKWVFKHNMGFMSFLGCTLILGSAITIVMTKRVAAAPKVEDVERQGNITGEAEASPMLEIARASSGEDREESEAR